ncbi:response regulator [Paenibacillus sp. FSL H8-0034]|uniref:response regulator n=1 Tax=Paenibacillus sp. FSL H8-0034 TaxID=2954671 RepID=UPI0030FB2750
MWTVLLVEDELFMRESIREIIAWEQFHFTLIGEAGDGKEALEIIEASNPDLVITDIVMPEMDGLELLKTARQRGYDCKFIMLTCLNEFHYAREALEFGASNYILKLSMSVNSLQESLLKVRKELEKNSQYNDYEISRYYLACWENMFTSKQSMETEISLVPPVRELYRQHLVMVCILHGQRNYTEADFLSLKLLEHPQRCVTHLYTQHGLTTAFCWSSEPILIQNNAAEVAEKGLLKLVSANSRGDRILELWLELLEQINEYWYDTKAPCRTFSTELYWEEESLFFQQFEQIKLEACKTMIDALWRKMSKQKLVMMEAKEMIVQIDNILSRQARHHLGNSDDLYLATDSEMLKQRLVSRLERYTSLRITSIDRQTDHSEINKLKEYMLKHYDVPITVKSMAKYVSLDETYLSNLFKQKTGETLIKYLHRIRVEKSQYYLEHTDIPIYELAERVGFINANYYNRIFKRMMGLTPSEYRTNHRSLQ